MNNLPLECSLAALAAVAECSTFYLAVTMFVKDALQEGVEADIVHDKSLMWACTKMCGQIALHACAAQRRPRQAVDVDNLRQQSNVGGDEKL